MAEGILAILRNATLPPDHLKPDRLRSHVLGTRLSGPHGHYQIPNLGMAGVADSNRLGPGQRILGQSDLHPVRDQIGKSVAKNRELNRSVTSPGKS